MKVNFYATLRQVVGQKTIEFDLPPGSTVRQLLEAMLSSHPALITELLDEHGNLYSHVHIFVNGRDFPFLEKELDTEILPTDVIGVFPAVGGG